MEIVRQSSDRGEAHSFGAPGCNLGEDDQFELLPCTIGKPSDLPIYLAVSPKTGIKTC
jgi:hypothetical protein